MQKPEMENGNADSLTSAQAQWPTATAARSGGNGELGRYDVLDYYFVLIISLDIFKNIHMITFNAHPV